MSLLSSPPHEKSPEAALTMEKKDHRVEVNIEDDADGDADAEEEEEDDDDGDIFEADDDEVEVVRDASRPSSALTSPKSHASMSVRSHSTRSLDMPAFHQEYQRVIVGTLSPAHSHSHTTHTHVSRDASQITQPTLVDSVHSRASEDDTEQFGSLGAIGLRMQSAIPQVSLTLTPPPSASRAPLISPSSSPPARSTTQSHSHSFPSSARDRHSSPPGTPPPHLPVVSRGSSINTGAVDSDMHSDDLDKAGRASSMGRASSVGHKDDQDNSGEEDDDFKSPVNTLAALDISQKYMLQTASRKTDSDFVNKLTNRLKQLPKTGSFSVPAKPEHHQPPPPERKPSVRPIAEVLADLDDALRAILRDDEAKCSEFISFQPSSNKGRIAVGLQSFKQNEVIFTERPFVSTVGPDADELPKELIKAEKDLPVPLLEVALLRKIFHSALARTLVKELHVTETALDNMDSRADKLFELWQTVPEMMNGLLMLSRAEFVQAATAVRLNAKSGRVPVAPPQLRLVAWNNAITTGEQKEENKIEVPCLALYRYSSLLSHSCEPNVEWLLNEDQSLSLRALRDIPPRTELCISYFQGNRLFQMMPEPRRQLMLKSTGFDFTCLCDRCVRDRGN